MKTPNEISREADVEVSGDGVVELQPLPPSSPHLATNPAENDGYDTAALHVLDDLKEAPKRPKGFVTDELPPGLFLDDERFPPEDGRKWSIVRSVEEAISWVEANGMPVYVSFDNDLGENQREGREFAAWLLERDMDNGTLPEGFGYYVHSQNVDAAGRIRSRIDAHLAFKNDEVESGRPWPSGLSKDVWSSAAPAR